MKVSSIDCRRLRKIIRKEYGSCLIVDCRPYFSFTNSNIKGSVNVNLNSVVVRRSRGGPVPLQFVIPDERALFRLREGSISAIVALDDRTSHWQKLKKDSVAQIVINTLSHLASGANICFLKGERFGEMNYFNIDKKKSRKVVFFLLNRPFKKPLRQLSFIFVCFYHLIYFILFHKSFEFVHIFICGDINSESVLYLLWLCMLLWHRLKDEIFFIIMTNCKYCLL